MGVQQLKKVFLLFLCLLITCPTISCKDKSTSVLSSDIEVVKVPNDKKVFDNLQQVEKNATIIVEAVIEESLGQNIVTDSANKNKKACPDYGYTKWEMKVTKIFTGDVKVGDKIPLLLEYYILKGLNDKEKLITYTALKPPIIGKEYILFLKYDKKQNAYVPICDYEGMFPKPDTELKDKAKKDKLQQSDLDVYSDDTLENIVPIYHKVVLKYFH